MSRGFSVMSTMSSVNGSNGSNGPSNPNTDTFNRIQSSQEDVSTERVVKEMESGSEHNSVEQPPPKKSHRYTKHQAEQLQLVFKECQYPDEEQRLKLSQDLGLDLIKVKFWFQNKRTHEKTLKIRNDNAALKKEHDKLKSENEEIQRALNEKNCIDCSEKAKRMHKLNLENSELKKEYKRYCDMVSKMLEHSKQTTGPLMSDSSLHSLGDINLEQENSVAMQLAISSLHQLTEMSRAFEPLWIKPSDGTGVEFLNVEEYARMFPWPLTSLEQLPKLRTEASRGTTVVPMNNVALVNNFLNADKWMEMFPCMISKAKTLQIIAGSSGNFNGTLQLMHAEMQMVSPLVPTREVQFLRYCHRNPEGTWVIVDFPADSLQSSDDASPCSVYKRKPSGCIIEEMPHGCSMVTWVEHVEVEDRPVHQIFNEFVSCGMAFGAAKWLAVLRRECERLASFMVQNIPDLGDSVISSGNARTNLMDLAKRMMRTFCVSLSRSNEQSWMALSDCSEDTERISIRCSTEPGHPIGLILIAASTTWLPYSHGQVFDHLRDERLRTQMNVSLDGNSIRIAYGSNPGNCISLLPINATLTSSQTVEYFMLQESYTNGSESVIAYTTLDSRGVQVVMSGSESSTIPLLPLGFVIHPTDRINSINTAQASSSRNTQGGSGCLLTVGYQILQSTDPCASVNLSRVNAMKDCLGTTIQQIKTALSGASTTGFMP